MAQKNFLRRYEMKVGVMGHKGFVIGKTSDSNPHALHISFSIEKSTAETANTAKIQVWNLSPTNLKILDKKDCVVELQAGYEDQIALILAGNVVTSTTDLDNADMLTEIEVVDGRVALRDTYITVSYKGKTNTKTIFNYIAGAMGVSVVYSPKCTFKDLPNGFSYVGPAKNALKKLCRATGLAWSIQNQVLQIRRPSEAISTRGYLLSADTGLLGVPKRITIEAQTSSSSDESRTENQIGYEVKYLMNGAIGVNDYVRLESSKVRGYFRVYKLTIDGDNLEGEWTCVAQLLEIKDSRENKKSKPKKDSGNSGKSTSSAIKRGDKVTVVETFSEGGKTKSRTYTGGKFTLYYSVFDVIQVTGDRVVIGIGSTVTAPVKLSNVRKA